MVESLSWESLAALHGTPACVAPDGFSEISARVRYRHWGWGHTNFGWREHRIIVNNRPWERTWVNRQSYAHPYQAPRAPVMDRRVERYELHEYRAPERRDADRGRDGDRGRDRRGGRDQ